MPQIESTCQSSRTVATGIIAVGHLCVIGLAIVLSAILSRLLEQQAYGTFRQVLFVYMTMAVVFQAGLPKATAYFLPKVSLAEGRQVLLRILLFLFGSGMIFSGLLYSGSDAIGALLDNPDLPGLLRAYAPMPALMLPALALPGACMSRGRAGAVAVFHVLSKLAALIGVVSPILLGYSIDVAIRLWVCISGVVLVVALHIMFTSYPRSRVGASPYGIIDILRFGLPLVAASIAGTLFAGADRVVVSRLFGAEAFAVYVNGAMQLPLIPLLTSSIGTVLLPAISRIAGSADGLEEAREIFRNAIRKSAGLLYPCTVFAFMYATDIMRVLYSERYVASAVFFRVYLALGIVRVVPFLPLMLGMGAVRHYVIGHVVACLVAWCGGMVLCTWLVDPLPAALCVVLGTDAMIGLFLVVLSRKLCLSLRHLIPWADLVQYLLISVCAGAAGWCATSLIVGNSGTAAVPRLMLGFLAFCIMYIAGISMLGCNPLNIAKPFLGRLIRVFGF